MEGFHSRGHVFSCSRMWLMMVMMMGMVVVVVESVDEVGLRDTFLHAIGQASVSDLVLQSPESGLNESCFDTSDQYGTLKNCLRSQCVSGDDVAKLYGVTSDQPLEAGILSKMSTGLLYVLTQRQSCSSEVLRHHEPPTAAAVWGYGFLFVTLINVCSLFGACVLPCVHSAVYKVLLLFMVALAVGTLVGSGLLVLIPEALQLTEEVSEGFVWKMTTVMGGVYLFFLVERIMRMINNWRENTKDKKEMDQMATEGTYTSFFQRHTPESPQARLKDTTQLHVQGLSNCAFTADEEGGRRPSGDLAVLAAAENGGANSTTTTTTPTSNGAISPGVSADIGGRKKIAPVAYMIIFGDALHNMIDGLSIGAAFTESTLLGISLSVAVMCEELPHELGDFAILLNSGMSMRKALMYNFLSSLSCYAGLIIGIQLGENTAANTWIFAIAGGMFLYISLADMLPEMNSAAESKDGQEFGEIKTFVVQNFGLLVGFGIILLLAVYGEKINFE
ncbi:metal cation symporter ZIP14-like [Babylonia areolata]|uniref:metal cation symporter ZIP14-like n=1 Tax=Babylonia areolata TaxID=304850 RepID=UPI003FD53739